jgi:hypothetical protein
MNVNMVIGGWISATSYIPHAKGSLSPLLSPGACAHPLNPRSCYIWRDFQSADYERFS